MIPQDDDRRNQSPEPTRSQPPNPILVRHLTRIQQEIQRLASNFEESDSPGSSEILLTREEAAKRLRISVRTLDDLEAGGRLRAVRIGRRVLYHPDNLDAFIRQQSREGSRR